MKKKISVFTHIIAMFFTSVYMYAHVPLLIDDSFGDDNQCDYELQENDASQQDKPCVEYIKNILSDAAMHIILAWLNTLDYVSDSYRACKNMSNLYDSYVKTNET